MKYLLYKLFSEVFIFSGLFLLFLCIIEDFQPGFVLLWFDLRIILAISFGSGLVALLFSKNRGKIEEI